MPEEKEQLRIPGHVSVKEAARMLGISYDRAYQHVKAGRLASKKVGGKHMIPIQAVEDFKGNPPGRVRAEPPDWRVYRSRVKISATDIEVQVCSGQEERVVAKFVAIQQAQRHTFTGTIARFVLEHESNPAIVSIWLVWKDTEMPDESLVQREFEAFKTEFADVLDWETALIRTKRGIIYT